LRNVYTFLLFFSVIGTSDGSFSQQARHIFAHSSAHLLQASAHSWQWLLLCLLHSSAHLLHISAQSWQISRDLLLPKLIICAAA
jgi:hypothetical protein